MPSKVTIVLIAALAASVSALPYSYNDLSARDPVDGQVAAPPPAQVDTPPPVAHHAHRPHHVNGHTPGHVHHHIPGQQRRLSHPHVHHPHPQALDAQSTTPPPPPSGTGPALSRREYIELYTRGPHGHNHPHEHHQHIPGNPPHHPHPHHHPHPPMADGPPANDAASTVPPPDASNPQRRELEERGFLEFVGLKAREAPLTVKQNEKLQKAKKVCEGLTAKKDQKPCHKNVDKIIQLTKERNYDVEQFIKLTNHHDIFTSSDPSSSSSSTSSLSSLSH